MFVIGITGGIGCGKSTAAQICKDYGLPVIDADAISKEVTLSDGEAIEEIIDNFGRGVIGSDGGLDRENMAKLAFADKKNLDVLSRIVHRHVIARIKAGVLKYEEAKEKALVLDVPIPVKEGFLDLCDLVWLIWAEEDLRIERLGARGMSSEEAQRRIRYQMTREEYESIANLVIENNGSIEELEKRVISQLDEELHMRGIKFN